MPFEHGKVLFDTSPLNHSYLSIEKNCFSMKISQCGLWSFLCLVGDGSGFNESWYRIVYNIIFINTFQLTSIPENETNNKEQ